MRILHTADWHIGQTLAGHDRSHEHCAALTELAQIARTREVDALIIAGDVFDTQNPSGESQRLFYDTLTALKAARPAMTIVVTAGNHDASGRLEAPRALLAPADIHVIGNVRRAGDAILWQPHVVRLTDAEGRHAANVLGVSYPTVACLPPLGKSNDPDAAQGSPIIAATRALYADLHAQSRHLTRDHPLIVTGHLHVAGGTESEGAERRILVGGEHAVPPDVFPQDAAYVALGHLHKAQAVGRPTIRYSGSLLPLSASELGYTHSVTLVTLDATGSATTENLPLTRPVAFLRIPDLGYAPIDELADRLSALNLPPDTPDPQRPFVQVALSREGLDSSYRAKLDAIAATFPIRLVEIKIAPLPTDAAAAALTSNALRRLSDLRPEDVFLQAFTRTHGREPTSDHLAAFHHAFATVEA